MKKRLVALTLVAAMALGMTACGSKRRAKYLLTTHLLTHFSYCCISRRRLDRL